MRAFAGAFARLIQLAPRPAEVAALDPAPSWAAWDHAWQGLWPRPEGPRRGSDTGTQGVLSGLVRRGIERQGEVLAEAIIDLEKQILRWPPDYLYAVADTSFYIEHEHKLEDIDFAPLLDSAWLDKRVTLIVPVIILDELDGLKQRDYPAREVARFLHPRRLRPSLR